MITSKEIIDEIDELIKYEGEGRLGNTIGLEEAGMDVVKIINEILLLPFNDMAKLLIELKNSKHGYIILDNYILADMNSVLYNKLISIYPILKV